MENTLRLAEAGPEPDDEALCRAFLAGDEAAFGTLVARHRVLVLSLMRRYASAPEDAADLAQQAFLRALEASRRRFSPSRLPPPTPAGAGAGSGPWRHRRPKPPASPRKRPWSARSGSGRCARRCSPCPVVS